MLLLIVFPVMPCKLKQNWNRLSLHIPDVCTIMNASFHTCKEGELMQLIIMQVSRGIHYCIHFIRGVYIIVFTLFEGYTLLYSLYSRGIHYCVDFIRGVYIIVLTSLEKAKVYPSNHSCISLPSHWPCHSLALITTEGYYFKVMHVL